jgi:hypothetical protein
MFIQKKKKKRLINIKPTTTLHVCPSGKVLTRIEALKSDKEVRQENEENGFFLILA